MARTKKTAHILRSLNLSASSSSSSGEDAGGIDSTEAVIPESMDVAFDDAGVPNAQDTVAEPTQREDEDAARGGAVRLTAESGAGHAEATMYGDECSGADGDTSDGADDDDARREHTSAVSRASRKRANSDCDDELYVAALKKYHKSWESFDKYLKRYQRHTLTVVAVAETENVRLRNRRIAQMKRLPQFEALPFRLPQSLVIESLALIERRTPFGDAIDLTTPTDAPDECWVVKIDGVGDVTQRQLMAMQYL
jgi:hypothetical protein